MTPAQALEGWCETPANSAEGAKHPHPAKQGALKTGVNSLGSGFQSDIIVTLDSTQHASNVPSATPVVTTTVAVGDVVDGKYRIDEVIGQGGMGQVLAATHLELHQKVALKFMSAELADVPSAVARFTREARAVAKLRSTHICRVLDIGETPGGAKYIVIEYLEGTDLAELLKDSGKLSTVDAIRYLMQACKALGEAHKRGIVHRDVKPANLFLDKGHGEPILKVLDFGISKSLTVDDSSLVTATNALMGSPLYMSPEQLLAPKDVDTRADIWSLGIVLHELLTGHPPLRAETLPEVIALIINERKTPATEISPTIPAKLQMIIARCLSRDPNARYQRTDLLENDLAEVLATTTAPPALPKRAQATLVEPPEDTDSSRIFFWLGTAGVVAAIIVAFVLASGPSNTRRIDSASSSAKPAIPEARNEPAPTPTPIEALTPEVTMDASVVPPQKDAPTKRQRRHKRRKTPRKRAQQSLMDPESEPLDSTRKKIPGNDDVMDPEL